MTAVARLAIPLLLLVTAAGTCFAQDQLIRIGYLGQQREARMPLGPLDQVATDEGLPGARLGIADNNSTGRFLGQKFDLRETVLAPGGDVVAAIRAFTDEGVSMVVADLDAEVLKAALAAPGAENITFFNGRAPDDALRGADCRPNLLHTAPSRAMLADAIAQYLVWKRWSRWFLLVGPTPGDAALAQAYRNSAARFGAEIAADRAWTFRPANGRADTGHVTLQGEIPAATQTGDYDVLVVADEADEFGAYLEGRTALPRPVAGTQGLTASGWSAVNEQWGATQLQTRFAKLAGRWMTAPDYAAWAAVRSIGEAATRTRRSDAPSLTAYIEGPDFLLGGFKGAAMSFRPWDGQMRQPILIAGERLLVSVSPQPGFLHQRTPLDTLGIDEGETACRR